MVQPNLIETLRQSVIAVLGAPPDPAPLDAEILAVEETPGYRREHVRYQVSPGDWCYAHLLFPTAPHPLADKKARGFPVVYCHHRYQPDHGIGKDEVIGLAGDPEHAIGMELCARGYAVFAPDALGYGERRSPYSDGHEFDEGYIFQELALRLLRGETLLRKLIEDVRRGLDYLETRADLNQKSIGFLGHGYGGAMAFWAMALDTRIRAGVSQQGALEYRDQVRRGDWFQTELVVPRLMQVADLHHVLTLVAPRPFLMSVLEEDTGSTDAAEIFRQALPVYERTGHGNRLGLYQYRTGSLEDGGFPHNMRHNAYTWLDTWLLPY